jgi:aerobic-type carbon monoxide dehydrogenase small subunit (CoxS/CutS family)
VQNEEMLDEITLFVNGRSLTAAVPAHTTLLQFLRDFAGLTGTKYGCGEGVCGACTVLVDGKAVRSCTVRAAEAGGKKITTIEGLAVEGKLHSVQRAFLEVEAFQCGFCTPGMILGAVSLLRETPAPREAEIRRRLEGHVCRCGTYPRIVEAVRLASREVRRG